jgi:sirohydrochlorin ferrochelatase
MSRGLVVFAHGSRAPGANHAVRELASSVARSSGLEHAEAAFLAPHSPSLEDVVDCFAAGGVTRILVVPYFVMAGLHLTEDLPGIVERLAGRHPGLEVRLAASLESHPGLPAMVADLARQALAAWP